MKALTTLLAALVMSATASFAEEGKAPKGDKPKHNPEETFKKHDTDGDGSISLNEFLARPRAQKDPEKAKAHFKKIDKDGNGSLSKAEIAEAHQHDGKKGGKGKCDKKDGAKATT